MDSAKGGRWGWVLRQCLLHFYLRDYPTCMWQRMLQVNCGFSPGSVFCLWCFRRVMLLWSASELSLRSYGGCLFAIFYKFPKLWSRHLSARCSLCGICYLISLYAFFFTPEASVPCLSRFWTGVCLFCRHWYLLVLRNNAQLSQLVLCQSLIYQPKLFSTLNQSPTPI